MDPAPSSSPGFLHSLRILGDGLVGSAQSRLQLLSIELQEEKYRVIQICFWISAVFFVGVLALTFASLALVYFFWDSARLAVLTGLALFYITTLVVMVVKFRGFLARQPQPFAATLEELEEDRACIRNES